MEVGKALESAGKWILPFFGILFVAQQIFGLYWEFGMAFGY